jgi:hypothetical protein
MTGGRVLVGITVATAVVLGAVSCGGDDGGDGAAVSADERTSTTGTTTTTTTAPLPFREALVVRFGDELGDGALAAEMVDALGVDAVQRLHQEVGDEVATDPLLAYQPPTVPDDEVDSLVVFAFGNRVAADGSLSPGPVNQDLADVTAAFVAEHPVPVFAQWEVADLLLQQGVPDVTSIDPDTGPDGEVVYLSTAGVAEKAVALADAVGVDLGQVGVVCFADHAGRCVLTAEEAGMDAAVPEGVALPSTYDPESGQEWTRDRLAYLTTDLQGRLLALDG